VYLKLIKELRALQRVTQTSDHALQINFNKNVHQKSSSTSTSTSKTVLVTVSQNDFRHVCWHNRAQLNPNPELIVSFRRVY
jgi:type IV secretory pathway TrbF-like protein